MRRILAIPLGLLILLFAAMFWSGGGVSKPADLLLRVGGSMVAFPEFDEVARLGREIRKADARVV